ncbi:MAG: hypothetical protein AUJ92_20155 [Armatimonadetes bacterium CG2_30_59_28]|nr:ROK family protein [Armatimonadota bacterium]OIO89926.1 MAG: hypothetical protein AUJ92_20155 [Armatimonadetes bacterium CG2_30_59_28]PIU66847.1 MAG: ROK family protein [Armatimonadetes bacterium CG07_land_8_20_14_0_80_59_28]PIX42102.1 MAG: ROK family protein [Armatimonadetes bacterium CG_4_8_14_3_um_filter_58_9]PIY47434.1 MAG: ROK family protein [Armatimonadetes bacterium CG_4_10_14_3_um_filter_59_10]
MSDIFLGADLGGSHIAVAAVNRQGDIVDKVEDPLTRAEDQDEIIRRIIHCFQKMRRKRQLRGKLNPQVGIGVNGVTDMERGIVVFSPNLKGQWRNVPLKKNLEAALRIPVAVANDVRAFTLAESRFGAGRGATNMVGIAIGTGIGGGLIIDGKLHTGLDTRGAELGHVIIDYNGPRCGCGSYGCVEAMAAAPAITGMAIGRIRQSAGSTLMYEFAEGDLNRVSPEVVARAAAAGDLAALEIMNKVGMYIGVAIASLLAALCPERVVIGGGVARAGEVLFDPIRRTLKKWVHTAPLRKIDVVPAELGTDAGVIGAAVWAMDHAER